MKKYSDDLKMLLKMDHAFYVNWLSENKLTLSIREGIYYAIGVHPNSMGTTLESIKIKVEYLEARVRFLKDLAFFNENEEEKEKFLKIINDDQIISPKDFTSLMYQYVSDFPKALSEAYFQVTGNSLILEDTSPIRQVYDEYAKYDLWTLKTACCLVSHMHPDSHALDVINGRMGGDKNLVNRTLFIPETYTFLFPNIESYRSTFSLAKAAIGAGKLKNIEQDFKGIKTNGLNPIEFLKWAKTKSINFHPALEELVLIYSSDNISPTSHFKRTKTKKLTPIQEDKLNTQKCAKAIWEKNPTMTIASMCKHEEILRYAKNYKPETRRKWLSEIAPKTVKEKKGRPRTQSKVLLT